MWGKSRYEPPSLTLPKATVFGQVTLLYTGKNAGYHGGHQCAWTIILGKVSFAGSGGGRSHVGQTC